MNRKLTSLILIILFFSVSAFVIIRYGRKHVEINFAASPFLQRKGVTDTASGSEWLRTQKTAQQLITRVDANGKDVESAINLANIYIKEARITGNFSYYNLAAMKQVDRVLKLQPEHFEANLLKALIYLSQHHFSDAIPLAEKARTINPHNAFVYGVLVDANLEMGDYETAIKNAGIMDSIRPDLNSYSRISYLREIHGDYSGAIAAMKLAVDAGRPGDEPTAWARIQLARLYMNTGERRQAEMQYLTALEERKNYGLAYVGLGQLALDQKDLSKAMMFTGRADNIVTDNSIQEQMGKIFRLQGENKKTNSHLNNWIGRMKEESGETSDDEELGHYADRELAYAYLLKDDHDNALNHALAEFNRRPKNIDVNETVAWVYYKMKDYPKSLKHINTALKTNSKNPGLLCAAGLIYAKNGNREKAKDLLAQGLVNNPVIDADLKTEASNTFKTL